MVPATAYVGVLFMSDSLTSVWGHTVHFAKFLMLRISKGYSSHSFHSVWGHTVHFAKFLMLRSQKAIPHTVFIHIFNQTLWYQGRIRGITFLRSGKFKNVMALCEDTSPHSTLAINLSWIHLAMIKQGLLYHLFQFGQNLHFQMFESGMLGPAVEHSTSDHWVPAFETRCIQVCGSSFHPSSHCPAPGLSLIRPWLLRSDVK